MHADGRLLTAEDILADEAYERGELWDGHFVVREPSGGPHGVVESRIAVALATGAGLVATGRVLGSSAGYVVARSPDRVLSPDASFLSYARCPAVPRLGFIDGAPELAVEIRSPRDTWIAVVEKGGVWIGHGARLVWCVDPEAEQVLVLRPGAEPLERGIDADLDLSPLAAVRIAVRTLLGEIR